MDIRITGGKNNVAADIVQIGSGASQQNYLLTEAITLQELQKATLQGNGFIISTGLITLTSSSQSAVFYLKNESQDILSVDRLLIPTLTSAGATTGYCTISGVRNPTGMSGGSGSDLVQYNPNFGSSNALTCSSEIGQEGATLTGGTSFTFFPRDVEKLEPLPVTVFMPPGSSLGVNVTPPAGNTSFSFAFAIECHLIV